jgi:hypothetical protein
MYEMIPRYVHEKTGAFALFPSDYSRPNRKWIATGLMEEGVIKRRRVLLSALQTVDDPSKPALQGEGLQ